MRSEKDPRMVLFSANQAQNVWICGYSMILLNFNCAVMSYMVYMQKGGYAEDDRTNYSSSTLCILIGILVGQIFFGVFGDIIGRRASFTVSSYIAIFASLCLAVASFYDDITSLSKFNFRLLRFAIGFGIGGLYPLIASITSESSQGSLAKSNLALVFGPIGGIGFLIATTIVLVVSYLPFAKTIQWRILLISRFLVSVPLLAFNIDETYNETQLTFGLETWQQALKDFSTEFKSFFAATEYRVFLMFSSICWFLSDFVHYGNLILQARYIDRLLRYDEAYISIRTVAFMGLAFALCFWIGSILSVFSLRSLSALALQLHGFLVSSVLFFLVAILRKTLSASMFYLPIFVYALTYVAYGFGSGPTTFIIPSILFRKSIRSSCNGISAAFGKLGAICGVLVASIVTEEVSYDMEIYGSVSIAGAAATLTLMQHYFPFISKRSNSTRKITESNSFPTYQILNQEDDPLSQDIT